MTPTVKLLIVVVLFFATFILAFAIFAPPVQAQQRTARWLVVCPACGASDRPASVIPWYGTGEVCIAAALNIEDEGRAIDDGTWARCVPNHSDIDRAIPMLTDQED